MEADAVPARLPAAVPADRTNLKDQVRYLENSVFDFGNLTCHQKVTSIVENPNIEIRNPKQCQNPNVLNSKQKCFFTVGFCFGH